MRMLLGQVAIETKLFLRDRSSVFWTFFFPVFLILLFGFVFSRPDSIKFHVGIVDQDNSPLSEKLVLSLSETSVLVLDKDDLAVIRHSIEENDQSVAIVVPAGFQQQVESGEGELQILYNPAQPQALQIVSSILERIVDQMSWKIVNRPRPIQVEPVAVQAVRQDQGYIAFLVPGLIGFSLMATCLFSIGVVVVSYREKGKLRRMAVTPLPKSIFIAGQIVTRYLVVLLQAILLIGIAAYVFDVHMIGNVVVFFAALTVGMLAFIALGYAIASVSKTSETASGIANVLFLPMTFLSGVYFSVEGLPKFLKPLVQFLPLTHLIRATRNIFNNGAGLAEVLPQVAILSVWALLCFLFSVKQFKWE